MKIIVLGSKGYIGENLSSFLETESHEVVRVDREILDFDDDDYFLTLSTLLDREKPLVIINGIGSIDSKVADDPHLLFNAIVLPTYALFRYFSQNIALSEVSVIILGSKSAGQPRLNYPIYAALKAAESGLSKTAHEIFEGSKVHWIELKIPRLLGGLGSLGALSKSGQSSVDLGLAELQSSIVKYISNSQL